MSSENVNEKFLQEGLDRRTEIILRNPLGEMSNRQMDLMNDFVRKSLLMQQEQEEVIKK